MNKLLLLGFFLLNCFPLVAQQVIKGVPADLASSEIVIVAYEPDNLIPAEAKSHEFIYKQDMPLAALCQQANLELREVAKAACTLPYRILSKPVAAEMSREKIYVFEPGKLYGSYGPWATVPLYLRHAATGQIYEIGFLPKNAIFSAEQVMRHFVQFLPKNLPVQASEK